jgi:formate-dependent nitrite reductase membrane component NrfD
MIELSNTRANQMIDPGLNIWGWEIPAYLFLGGIVAGLMVLAGINMLQTFSGQRRNGGYPVQAPLLALVLLSLGMLALFLDLEHKLYVWDVYITFEPTSPMSWGSWVLLLVYPVLMVSALIRLPDAWPWLGARVPLLAALSEWLLARPGAIRLLAWLNIAVGVAVGIYTGILLSTMVARPLWNSAVLGPLFLFSGLSAAAALVVLLARFSDSEPAPATMIGGALSAMLQPLEAAVRPERADAAAMTRADIAFLAVELVLLALLLIGLLTASESHVQAAHLLMSGPWSFAFWGVVVALGILVPLVIETLEMAHKLRHSVVPAVLVLVGGFALRWVLVEVGQASHLVAAAGF